MTDPVDDKPLVSEEGPAVHEWIRRLQAGATTAKAIPREAQIRIVEFLTSEGYSLADIGGVLGVHDRTVARLRSAGKKANALKITPDFPEVMAGSIVREAETEVQRIRRTLRDKEISPEAKISGSLACWTIYRGLTELLQKLGCLPTAPTHLRGELLHQVQHQVMEPAAMVLELDRIRQIAESQPGSSPEHLTRIEAIRAEVRKVEISNQIQTLSTVLEKKEELDD